MTEAGQWVTVAVPSNDPGWNKGKWRYTGGVVEYVDGVSTNPIQNTIWEKWVPAAIVPTEPGFYLDNSSDIWVLDESGTWRCFGQDLFDSFSSLITSKPEDYLPFRKAVVKEASNV